ncbi:MAG: helix-turn-helix domain containing protein, partial [Holosporales bacterium]|nr:helix-turn-helix domain containing protein [Holosporales bacterium]
MFNTFHGVIIAYSTDFRRQVLKHYAKTRSMSKTAKEFNINRQTISDWK